MAEFSTRPSLKIEAAALHINAKHNLITQQKTKCQEPLLDPHTWRSCTTIHLAAGFYKALMDCNFAASFLPRSASH